MRFSWKQLSTTLTRRWRNAIVGLFLLLASNLTLAEPVKVLLLASKDTAVYQKVVSSLEEKLSTKLETAISYRPDEVQQATLASYDLVVSIGTNATRKTLATGTDTKIFSTFIPKPSFDAISRKYGRKIQQHKLTALFLDQPIERQLQLIKLISPKVKSLGTIVSKKSKQKIPELELTADSLDLKLVFEELDDQQNPVETLGPIITKSDAFLALPDRAVFNRSTAKWILLMTFRQKIPLIAFSKSYVDAGALAAIYSTPTSVGEETADIINAWLASAKKPLPKPNYPKQFSLSINEGAANSLGIKPPDKQQIIERLSQQ